MPPAQSIEALVELEQSREGVGLDVREFSKLAKD